MHYKKSFITLYIFGSTTGESAATYFIFPFIELIKKELTGLAELRSFSIDTVKSGLL